MNASPLPVTTWLLPAPPPPLFKLPCSWWEARSSPYSVQMQPTNTPTELPKRSLEDLRGRHAPCTTGCTWVWGCTGAHVVCAAVPGCVCLLFTVAKHWSVQALYGAGSISAPCRLPVVAFPRADGSRSGTSQNRILNAPLFLSAIPSNPIIPESHQPWKLWWLPAQGFVLTLLRAMHSGLDCRCLIIGHTLSSQRTCPWPLDCHAHQTCLPLSANACALSSRSSRVWGSMTAASEAGMPKAGASKECTFGTKAPNLEDTRPLLLPGGACVHVDKGLAWFPYVVSCTLL